MLPVTRLGDMSSGDPCGAGPRKCIGGSSDVFVNMLPMHGYGHPWAPHSCPKSPPHDAVTVGGSGSVFVNFVPVARIGDPISCGSKIVQGSADVFVGG